MRFRSNEFYLHAMLCLVLVVIPLMLQLESTSLSFRFMSHFWLMIFGLLLTFYFNYLYAIDKLLYRKRYLLFILFNVVLFIFTNFFESFVSELLADPERQNRRRQSFGWMQTMFVYNRLIFTALGVGTSLAVRYARRLIDSEKERKQLENEKLTSEISLLKYQMQPHFFFNTLNNIYALIAKSPADAQKAVHSLSKMMRYILYENTAETISLSKELDFIANYNKLMQLRLNDKVKVSCSLPDDTDEVCIPPLLLIPLVENAFKHGVSYDTDSFINYSLSLHDDKIVFEVENSLIPSESEDRSHSGIGLQNLRKRLEIIYGDAALFDAGVSDHNTFIARLTLPILPADAPSL